MKFEELNIKKELLDAVKKMGFETATEIQEKTIPAIFEGKDIVGQSQTGSGKTAAFGLPILNNIEHGAGVQAIILTPTRELCVQVYDTLKELSSFMKIKFASIYGGVSINPQIDALRRADIVVGTPGRVMDHLERRTMTLENVRYFVLDEADRMLEMGFVDDIKKILKSVPKEKQALLFSATMPTPIKTIVNQNFKNPVYIVGQKHVDKNLLKQTYYNIQSQEKFSLLLHILKERKGTSLIFCATRREVDIVTDNLRKNGMKAVAIHGGLTQNKRLQVVEMIKKDHVHILVATDVAARGLDIRNISLVINYDLSKSSEEYTHRIGRTARAGDEGEAITLLTQSDYGNFSKILEDRSLKINKGQTPQFAMVKFERSQGNRSQGRSFGGARGGSNRSNSRSGNPRRFDRPTGSGDRRSDSNSERSEGNREGRDNRQSSFGSRREGNSSGGSSYGRSSNPSYHRRDGGGSREGGNARNETVSDRNDRRRRREGR